MPTNPLIEPETERAIIASALSGLPWDGAWIEPEDFGIDPHRYIWEALLTVKSHGHEPDLLTVSEQLKRDGHLGKRVSMNLLMELTQPEAIPLVQNWPEWVAIVKDRALRRQAQAEMLKLARDVQDLRKDPNALALVGSDRLANLAASGALELHDAEYGLELLKAQQEKIQRREFMGALETGIDGWDRYLGGLTPGVVTIIAGAPGTVKTGTIIRMKMNLAMKDYNVGSFMLEDPIVSYLKRPVSSASKLQLRKIGNQLMSTEEFDRFLYGIERMRPFARRIITEDRTSLSAARIATLSRQMVVQKGCKAIFIDNSSEIDHSAADGDRYDIQIGNGLRMIRDVAKTMMVPIVLLVHLKRPHDAKTEPRHVRPNCALLKNSGAYEEAARVIVGQWIDEDHPNHISYEVMKQQEGDKEFTFRQPFDSVTGLVENKGGEGPGGFVGY